MASRIPLVQDDALIGLDGKPLASEPVNGWSGLPVEVHPHMRKGEVAHRYNPSALILCRRGARGRSRIRSGTHTYDLIVEPGQVDVFPVGFRMDHGWWDCTPGEVCAVELEPARLRGLMGEGAESVDLSMRLSGRDPILERLIDCIRLEIEAGCPSGRLYAEGLSLAVIGCLRSRHARPERAALSALRLSQGQLQKTRNYIESHLTADLRIGELAALHDMSPNRFASLFKVTTGTTPHRFVVDRRIEAARRLLAGPMSLAEIALAVGFSSQSHFTQTFRRCTGWSPGRLRRSF